MLATFPGRRSTVTSWDLTKIPCLENAGSFLQPPAHQLDTSPVEGVGNAACEKRQSLGFLKF